MIIAGTTEVFLNHFARGMTPFSSVMAPRFYHQVSFETLSFRNIQLDLSYYSSADPQRGVLRELDDGEQRPLRASCADEGGPSKERTCP